MTESASGDSAGPVPLDYASNPRGTRWARRIVRAAIALLIITIGWFAYANRDEIGLRARRVYWARQCAIHVTPPGTILVENDPVKAKALADSNSDYVYFPATSPPGSMLQYQAPHAWAEYVPRAWREYEQLAPQQRQQRQHDNAVVFLGRRQTPAGATRIVLIRGAQTNALLFDRFVEAIVLVPPSSFGALIPDSSIRQAFQGSGQWLDATLQPGAADPTDPTHLTIDFEIESRGVGKPSRKGTLDVYLRNDDTLDIRVRDPATTQGL